MSTYEIIAELEMVHEEEMESEELLSKIKGIEFQEIKELEREIALQNARNSWY